MDNKSYAAGLRALADFYEQTPDMPRPYGQFVFMHERQSFLEAAVMLCKGATVEKRADPLDHAYPNYSVIRKFGEIELHIQIARSLICRKIRDAEYECPDSLLEAAAEYAEQPSDSVELTDQETAQDLAATAKESIEAAQ